MQEISAVKVNQLPPAHFKNHVFEKTYKSPYKEAQLWEWLNDPKTFTDSQIFPYRVEFLLNKEQPTAFTPGVLNNHHGPFLSLAGEIGEVSTHYRDLQYYYGSYAFSFRWIRPYRLEFISDTTENGSTVTVRLSTYTHPSLYNLWNWSQGIFWSRFGRWMNRSVKKMNKH